MPFESKPGSPRPMITGTNEYPESLVPELPSNLALANPGLEEWVTETNRRYRELVDVLLRKERAASQEFDTLALRVDEVENA